MRIAIVGIGGVGGYYGGLLARRYVGAPDVQVVFVSRGANLDAIRANGLRVTTPTETFTALPALATDQPRECGPCDLVIFCTKTYHLEDAARQMAAVVDSGTSVLSVMNGVDNTERLRKFYPRSHLLNGAVYLTTTLTAPGQVQFIGGAGRLVFGADEGEHERFRPLETLLKAAGIKAEYSENVRLAVWEKFLFISPLACATSCLSKTFGELSSAPDAWALLDGLLHELEAVARAENIRLPENIHQTTLAKVGGFPPDTKTSMQVDYEKNRPTELETFCGYVVRAAQRLNVSVPLYQQVHAELKKRA